MKDEMSFSEKLRAGWTKERLMAYYALTEAQYAKVMRCLRAIGSMGSEGAV
jgi:hypothetical protein